MAENQQPMRLKNFIENYAGQSVFAFARSVLGKDGTILYNIINNVNGLSINVLDGIRKVYPELNVDWMINGKGEMIDGLKKGVGERIVRFIKFKKLSNSKFEQLCGLKNYRIVKGYLNFHEMTLIKARFPDLNVDWLKTGEGDMLVTENKTDTESKLPESDVTEVEYYVDKVLPEDDEQPDGKVQANEMASDFKLYDSFESNNMGLLIPFNLGDCDTEITQLDLQPISINSIMTNKVEFYYQLQTYDLWPQLSKGDWLLLKRGNKEQMISGKVYFMNTEPFKVQCRIFRDKGDYILLQDINGVQDDLILQSKAQIKEVLDVVAAFRNNPLTPLASSEIGRELSKRDKMLDIRDKQIDMSLKLCQDSIGLNKSAIEEIIRSNKRMEQLMFANK